MNYESSEIQRIRSETEASRAADRRSPFERDRSRIIHSSAFRRLQGKTQVFGLGSSDFFRTRLTHSLEVAQIGKGLAINSGKADPDLVELACLSHDIGHPPFGHAGEDALKLLMEEYGGFEANAQNLRIINRLEAKHELGGLNLSRASIDAILKYTSSYSDVRSRETNYRKWKFYYDDDNELVKWAKEGAPTSDTNSFECQIMDLADDIAYSTHDLEDGLKGGMINLDRISHAEKKVRDEFTKRGKDWDEKIWHSVIDKIQELSKVRGTYYEIKIKRKKIVSDSINELISSAQFPQRVDAEKYPSRYRYYVLVPPEIENKLKMMQSLVWEMIISDQRVATLERKGQHIISELFKQFTEDGESTKKLFPMDFREQLDMGVDQHRIACDYIAGMTDAYILKMYSRIIESDIHSVFDIL